MTSHSSSDTLHLERLAPGEARVEQPSNDALATPGSQEELDRFAALQSRLHQQYRDVFPDPLRSRSVVIVPSLSLDREELEKVTGVSHYEERLLCMLMLLRLPRTRVVYVSSEPIAQSIIDYFLHLLPGIPETHARDRLTLLSCHDSRTVPLTQKILERPRLQRRILDAIPDRETAHISCFNSTGLERTLAVRLGLPLYACDPRLNHLGTKSGSRTLFKRAGVKLADGFEDLRDDGDIVDALAELKARDPQLRRSVVKLNDGFSGEGNAVFSYEGAPEKGGLSAWVRDQLPRRIAFEAASERWDSYRQKFAEMGGIVECFVEGEVKRSPSVQCRIDPLGRTSVISTHDQVLGGSNGQVFEGCTFPAASDYRLELQEQAVQVSRLMEEEGVLGRFGLDFISVKCESGWEHYAVEINLRKGGTTHPFLTLQFLTDGSYEEESGLYRIPTGQMRFYYASDNLVTDAGRGLTPADLVDIAVENRLHFHGTTQEGVVFHLIGALSEFGKIGVVCVGATRERARELYEETVKVLEAESGVSDDRTVWSRLT